MKKLKESQAKTDTYPYVSYKTFQTFIDSLVREGVPDIIDRTAMKDLNSLNQGLVLATLRFLNLIDANGNVDHNEFDKLVTGWTGDRQQVLAPILKSSYPHLLAANDFHLDRAVPSQLSAKFSGIKNPDVQRKAKTFFLRAATDAGITISARIQPSLRGTRRRSSGKNNDEQPSKKSSEKKGKRQHTLPEHEQPEEETKSLTFYQRELQRMREEFPAFPDQGTEEEKAEWWGRRYELLDRIGASDGITTLPSEKPKKSEESK